MGRNSDKKVKAERVNALRKQYDAFLEEDKKRKERNEYILGRLDNMRYSATAVQIRHKPIVIGDVMPVIPLPFHRPVYRPDPFERREVQPVHPEYQINRPTSQNLQLDVPRTHLENTALLREISKKYILIPKLRSSIASDDYIGTIGPQSLPTIASSSPLTNTSSKEDWKSKYEILEQLKKKDKEEQAEKYGDEELFPVKEKQATNVIKKKSDSIVPPKNDLELYKPQTQGDIYGLQSYDTKESTIKYEQEPPEKDSSVEQPKGESEPQCVDRSKISDSKIQEPNTEQSPVSSTSPNVNPEPDEEYETYDGYNLQSQATVNYAPIESVPTVTENYENSYPTPEFNTEFANKTQQQISDVSQHEEYPVQYEQPILSEGQYPDNENVYLDPDDYSPIQVLDPTAVVDQIHKPAADDAPGLKEEEEVTEYPVVMLNVQDFTPKEGVQLIDGVNINPKHMASDENIDPGVYETVTQPETAEETVVHQDTSEIEAFDTEQKEMFYSEDTVQYEYEQQPGEVHNQEYTAPQENAYYESPAAAQEQEYPAEINEHEESTSRYDQNYEEQYGQQYDQQYQEQQQYVQPEGYDQTGQQYVQQEGYGQTNEQYAQQGAYDQTGQQYDQQEGYDQTDQQYVQQEEYDHAGYQGYEYQQQDQDSVQNIAQAMDNEQGFVDQQNYDANQANIAEPIQQAVDQNVS